MREERVSCPRLFVLVWARWLSRDLTPLGRCQHLVCWDSLLGLPSISPYLRQGKENEVTEGIGQKLLGFQMGISGSIQLPLLEWGLAKAREALCCILVILAHFPTLCLFKCEVGLVKAAVLPDPGVRVGLESKGPMYHAWPVG